MAVSHKHKVIFIHIPKTGGSSISKALGVYGKNSVRNAWGSRRQHFTITELLSERCITKKEAKLYFKFSFVRNPFDKIISLYEFFCHRQYYQYKGQDKPNLRRFLLDAFGKMDKGTEKRPFYFRRQSEYLFDGDSCLVDFVGKFENLRKDFRKISKRLKISSKLPHLKKSHRKSYRSYYNETSRQLVEEFYKDDLERFGYTY